MSSDLTALLVRQGEHDVESIERTLRQVGYMDVWLRIVPLKDLNLLQIELWDSQGRPAIQPALVSALSAEGKRATFVHVNHQAPQALVHAFVGGQETLGWVGDPKDLEAHLIASVGHRLAELVGADDGSRIGPGVAASATCGVVRGRVIGAPRGMPLMLDSFYFHDAGTDLDKGDRVALIAFDGAALKRAWESVPGRQLAERVAAMPDAVYGPLTAARDAAVEALGTLGDQTPAAAGLTSLPALELLTLSVSCLYAGGEPMRFIDERFLPLFSLAPGDPVFDPDELESLDAGITLLEAMVEVLPYASPEGQMLEQVGDDELGPLAPWARPGEEYVGSLFVLQSDRLRKLLTTTNAQQIGGRAQAFARAWWAARAGQTEEGFPDWERALLERGKAEWDRFGRTWAEWLVVLDLSEKNKLDVALWFYGGA
ncbi:MAG TPA: hypothetical protein VH877_07240, partial [Polyangia bacterium]|nr:hypothetical protein [Polyangia bacterium]